MAYLECPYLGAEVELTPERERHIAERHPDLLPQHKDLVALTLAKPDQVRASARFGNARIFARWYNELRGGKHVVVVVVSEHSRAARHWVVTAYMARRLSEGEVLWPPS